MKAVTLSPPRFLHIANGTCTTAILETAEIPGILSIWADPLYEGPVPGGLSDEELLHVRARFLAQPTERAYAEAVDGLTGWRAIIDRHALYDELVLWFEHDLFDQLNLIQNLNWTRDRVSATKVVSLVCIGSFPGHPRFKGLGELRPDEIASLLETRQRVSTDQFTVAERAWRAFRDSTPAALDDLRHTDTSALPFLAAAIRRFLEEYPSTFNGLSRSEHRLLQLASDGPIALSAAFPRMHDAEQAYYITDTSLVRLAEAMSRTPCALISYDRHGIRNIRKPNGTVALADLGRDVLNGQRDRIATCGIDRWLGGVHLRNGAETWRWDDQRQGMTRA